MLERQCGVNETASSDDLPLLIFTPCVVPAHTESGSSTANRMCRSDSMRLIGQGHNRHYSTFLAWSTLAGDGGGGTTILGTLSRACREADMEIHWGLPAPSASHVNKSAHRCNLQAQPRFQVTTDPVNTLHATS